KRQVTICLQSGLRPSLICQTLEKLAGETLMPATSLRRNRNERILRAVRPNAGLEADYRRKLEALVDALHKSTQYWITATYRKNPPKLAQDETPAQAFIRSI